MADVFDAHGEVRVHALTGAYCACAPNLAAVGTSPTQLCAQVRVNEMARELERRVGAASDAEGRRPAADGGGWWKPGLAWPGRARQAGKKMNPARQALTMAE